MSDIQHTILDETRKELIEQGESPDEAENLLKLLDILLTSSIRHAPGTATSPEQLARQLIENRALLSLLKQQTEELEALKKLSINLTSSLDLPAVLDAVVTEAIRLIDKARDVNIFLYKNHRLSFGAALDSDGTRNKPWSKPRSNGLTYTVARSGETLIV